MNRFLKAALAGIVSLGFAVSPAFAAGKITVQGSDTLLEMVTAEAGAFMKAHPDASIQVTGGGSGTGIAALLNGTTDIANSSRPIKKKEIKSVEEKGGKVFEVAIALDGLSVYLNPKNKIEDLSMAQIKDIYTGKINNWKEVGGEDAKIIRYTRENNSGTYVFFKEHVLKDENYSADSQSMPGTASVVNAVSKDPNSIGFGGLSYAEGVKACKVDGVAPSMETVISGKYPVSRSLFQYTNGKPKDLAKEFIAFELSPEGQKFAADAGYIQLPEDMRKKSVNELN